MIVGEKQHGKSKGKTAKATKHGLRPHELRQQDDATKSIPGQPTARPGSVPKSPKA
jgi:hypothetical protein